MSIAENLTRVHERIVRAAEAADRTADEVALVGVTKYVGPREVAELVAAGCHELGESRPQELWKKAEALTAELEKGDGSRFHAAAVAEAGTLPPETPPVPFFVRWHLVGHLQRNKIRRTLPLVSLLHSVDSERLLAAIDEELKRTRDSAELASSTPLELLLEVNTSGESAKHGLAPDEVEPILAAAADYPNVAIRGLMTMAALEGGPTVAAGNFATLRELRDRLRPVAPDCVQLDELSMGMSGDFETAIREGATIVRIGSLLWENP